MLHQLLDFFVFHLLLIQSSQVEIMDIFLSIFPFLCVEANSESSGLALWIGLGKMTLIWLL